MRSDYLENRQKILKVFEQAIQGTGKALPSMTDVVRQSGLGRGTVYRHFATPGDVLYAYLEDGFTRLYTTYEPEWIKADKAGQRAEFEAFLLRCIDFTLENMALLSSPEYRESEGKTLAKTELRRKIYVTATNISDVPLKPIELSKWVDAIAYCVEPDHLGSSSPKEIRPELSVRIAMTLFDEALA